MESPERYLRALGKAIEQRRSGQGLSLEAAADRWGVDRSCLEALERGQANPGFQSLLRLADGMAVAPAELFEAAQRLADADEDDR